MFIPRNEPGVAYLFSRFHEKLGFEEIVDISTMTPDIFARRSRKQVAIELEFKSSSAIRHYRVARENPRDGRWIRDKGNWRFVLKDGRIKYDLRDPDNKYRLDRDRNLLLLRTAKEKFNIIVCWEKDEVFEENMEIIELRKALKGQPT